MANPSHQQKQLSTFLKGLQSRQQKPEQEEKIILIIGNISEEIISFLANSNIVYERASSIYAINASSCSTKKFDAITFSLPKNMNKPSYTVDDFLKLYKLLKNGGQLLIPELQIELSELQRGNRQTDPENFDHYLARQLEMIRTLSNTTTRRIINNLSLHLTVPDYDDELLNAFVNTYVSEIRQDNLKFIAETCGFSFVKYVEFSPISNQQMQYPSVLLDCKIYGYYECTKGEI